MINSAGYRSLATAVERDIMKWPERKAEWAEKMEWAVNRAKHYAEKTGLDAGDILTAWERQRTYWYMNYYQDVKQPCLDNAAVRVFATIDEARNSFRGEGFRCPMCGARTMSPYDCNGSGAKATGEPCDWKSYGLFGCLGKGAFVFTKDTMNVSAIFMPLAWERRSV